jgi:hypothetical protein
MRATKAQIGGMVAIAALALAGLTAAYVVHRRGLGACEVLSRAEVKRIAGVADPPEPFEPENTGIRSTGCSYGPGEPGVYVTVFSIAHGGSDMMRRARTLGEAHGAVSKSLKGPGYDGYATGGPREGSESAVVVKHDHYIDILVYNAPPGTAEQLAIVAARRLR